MADYKVGVELVLTGSIAAALAAVATQLTNLHTQIGNVGTAFSGWRAVLVGGAGVAVGMSVIGALDAVAQKGNEVLNQMARLRMQGQSTSGLEAIYKQAFEATGKGAGRFYTPSEHLGVYKGLTYAEGHEEEAKAAMEQAAKLNAIMTLSMGKKLTAQQVEAQTFAVYKLLEEQNMFTPSRTADAQKLLEGIAKDIAMTGGKITPETYRMNTIYARGSAYGFMSPQALAMEHPFATQYFPWLMQGMGTGRGGISGAGNAIETFVRQAAGGIMTPSAGLEWERLGLLTGPARPKGPQPTLDPELARIHPYEWIQQHLTPALQQHGYTTQAQISQQIQKMFTNRVAAAGANYMVLGGRAFAGEESPGEKHARMFGKVPSYEALTQEAMKSPLGMETMLATQQQRMMEAVGTAIDPIRLKIIEKITEIFTTIGNIVSQPGMDEKIKGISVAIAALAVGLTTLGGAAVIGGLTALAGPAGLLAALGAALLALSPKVQQAVADFGNALITTDKIKIQEAAKQLGVAIAVAIISGLNDAAQGVVDVAKAAGAKAGEAIFGRNADDFHKKHPYFGQPHLPGGLTGPGMPHGWQSNPNLVPAPEGLLHKSSNAMSGSGGGQTMAVNNVIMLDGSAIARAVHDYLVSDMEHPKQSGHFDGRSDFTSPDHQPINS